MTVLTSDTSSTAYNSSVRGSGPSALRTDGLCHGSRRATAAPTGPEGPAGHLANTTNVIRYDSKRLHSIVALNIFKKESNPIPPCERIGESMKSILCLIVGLCLFLPNIIVAEEVVLVPFGEKSILSLRTSDGNFVLTGDWYALDFNDSDWESLLMPLGASYLVDGDTVCQNSYETFWGDATYILQRYWFELPDTFNSIYLNIRSGTYQFIVNGSAGSGLHGPLDGCPYVERQIDLTDSNSYITSFNDPQFHSGINLIVFRVQQYHGAYWDFSITVEVPTVSTDESSWGKIKKTYTIP